MMMSGTDKVIWFTQNKSGMLVLNRPDGTKTINRRKYDPSDPMALYFERAKMYMQENGIWDATAFACTVQTPLYFQPKYSDDKTYVFIGLDGAERSIFPILSEDVVAECRKNVEDFYASPVLQAGWPGFIMFPVWLEYMNTENKFRPIFIDEIGLNQSAVSGREIYPVPGPIDDMESFCFQMKEVFNQRNEEGF